MTAALGQELAKVAVRADARTIRETLRRIKHNHRLAALRLFGRRKTARALDYLDRDRASVEIPIYVTPAEFDGRYASYVDKERSEFFALSRDVSLRGIGFTHDVPLDAHYTIVTFDLIDDKAVTLLLEIRWSNIPTSSSLMSGGLFLGIIQEND